jgi:hypothetical protein
MSMFHIVTHRDGTRIAINTADIQAFAEEDGQPWLVNGQQQTKRYTVVYMRSGQQWFIHDDEREAFDAVMASIQGYPVAAGFDDDAA